MPLPRRSLRGSRLHAGAALAAALLALPGGNASAQDGAGASAPLPGARADDVRLETIGYRLATANADRCSEPEMLTGLMLHDRASYDPEYRLAIAKAYGLTYGFGVREVVPGSSGERAGLRKDDEIIALDGTDLKDFAPDLIGSEASSDRTERFVDLLDRTLRKGPATLTLRRAGAIVTLTLAGDPGCGGRFVAARSPELNAWADGKYVAVTTRMIRFAGDDQELAFVVAHEMSHNILHHQERIKGSSGVFAQLGIGAKEIKATEIEADAYAVGLLASAGFDLSAPERFLRRSGKVRWMDLPITHPGVARRVAIVKEAVAKLERDGAAAEPSVRRARTAGPRVTPMAIRFDMPGLTAPIAAEIPTGELATISLPAPFDPPRRGATAAVSVRWRCSMGAATRYSCAPSIVAEAADRLLANDGEALAAMPL